MRNGQWGETDHPLFLENLWMKCVGDTTCTDTVLPVVACHTSSLPVQVILLLHAVLVFTVKLNMLLLADPVFSRFSTLLIAKGKLL